MKITNLFIISALICFILSCSYKDGSRTQPQTDSTQTVRLDIQKVTGVARIEPEKGLLYIYAKTNGSIAKILAEENQQVAQGSLLLVLDNATDRALLEVEESKISAQFSAIEAAKQNEASLKNDLDKAKSDIALNKKLFEAKAITEQALNDNKAKMEKLSSDYAKAVADKNQQINKMEEIKANVNYRRSVLKEKQLKTVFAGKVLQWDVHNGDYVTQGKKLGQFAPDGALVAVTEVDELFQDKVKKGMKTEIFSQLNGEKIATGTVVYVANFLKKKSLFSDDNTVEDRRVKEVKVRLDSNSKAIINSKVDCVIYLK
jgi:HlyD family secretion protein